MCIKGFCDECKTDVDKIHCYLVSKNYSPIS